MVLRHVVSTRCEGRGVECRPTVTENGHLERSNPSWLSRRPDERREVSAQCWTGEGDQAGCLDGVGYPKKQRPAGKPSDKLTLRLRSGQAVGLLHERTPEQVESESYGRRVLRTEDRTLSNPKRAGVKLWG